jgi:23S rRNA pseudouridine1911/1915/1917 synthase
MSAGCSEQPDNLCCQDTFEYHIKVEHTGLRLDHYLVLQLPLLSRSQLTNSIKSGFVTVDGVLAKASRKLKAGEKVCGFLPKAAPIDILPQKIDFSILYEDEDLLVISKPPQLVVHPGSGNPDKTLVNGLVYYCENISDVGDLVRPGIVHRLDKDTSGIMVVAKKNNVHRLLVDDFKERRVKKKYFALVHGVLKDNEGRICLPIGRHPVNRKKMAVREQNGKFAVSNWRVEKTFLNRYSLVKIIIETGRTHQIRVHMAYLGHPVAGDALYGPSKVDSLFPRQMLHSSEISFNHPLKGRKISIKAPLWPDMLSVIDSLEDSGGR